MTNSSELIDHLSSEKRELLEMLLREDSADQVPLSFAQQRLWFLQQLDPDSPQYNLPAAVRLRGQLATDALARGLNAIVERHESLRTTFRIVGGEPAQVIAPALTLALPVVELDGHAEAEREELAQRMARAEAARPFDLEQGPLLRAQLLRLGDQDHLLLITMHHIISDGWSVSIFVSELATLYDAELRGRAGALPELPIQYADYALWQREQLQGPEFALQLDYWRRRLGGTLPILALPTDRARPAVPSLRGALHSFRLSPELTDALLDLSRREGVTPFILLLTAFATLLHRYSGQADLLIGTPIANRTIEEIEPLIGFFTNTLVLRADLAGNPTFRAALGRVREVTLEAYDHQDVPFEKLVEVLQPERNLSHTPLFQVLFAFHNNPLPALQLPGLDLRMVELDSGSAKFDLRLAMVNTPRGFYCTVEYRTDLFEAATIARMAGHFQTLLAGVTDDPGCRVSALPLLPEAELRQVLTGWGAIRPAAPADGCIHEMFEEQAAQTPDMPALVFEGRRMSYAELDRRANGLAHQLRARGVGPDVRVGICAERSPEMIVALLAVLKAGGAYVPLDPSFPAERLAAMLADSGAALALAQPHLFERLPAAQALFALDPAPPAERADAPCSGVTPANLAYVMYTSGSTGTPKGATIEHRNLLCYVRGVVERLELPPGASFATVSTLAADLGHTSIYAALCTGGSLHIIAQERLGDPAALAEIFTREPVDCLKIVPSHLDAVLSAAVLPRKRLVLGGEATGWELIERIRALAPGCTILNHYGPTETTVGALAYPLVDREAAERAATLPLGRPLAGAAVYLLDAYGQPVPLGVPGELYIGGAGVARGYLGRPDLTAERFVPSPLSVVSSQLQRATDNGQLTTDNRLYKTGDLGRYLPDGAIEFLGRLDGQVKLRGFRIELGEIEATLARLPQVRQAVVLLREDQPGQKWLVAYIVPTTEDRGLKIEDSSLAAQGKLSSILYPLSSELRQYLRERLPDYMIPAAFVTLNALPLTPNGKLDRRALPAPDVLAAPISGFVAPRTQAEELVAGIWQTVLGVARVGAHDNFFALGGHSLLATQVVLRLRAAFGVELPLRSLFEAPTVAGLVERIAQAGAAGALPPLVPMPHDGDPSTGSGQGLPLSYAQERLWFLHQMDADGAVYNLAYFVRLRGALDHDALAAGLDEIVRRHAVLRTSFATLVGQPIQVIAPVGAHRDTPLPLIDLRERPAEARADEARRLAAAEAVRPFDLAHGPLLRATLVRQADDEHLLLLTLHHIVSDAWSRAVLTRELAALYAAFRAGQPASLSALPIQYADYAAWQRQWLQGPQFEQQLGYWRRQLAGLAPLVLPSDRSRPLVQTFNGATLRFRLSPELTAGLSDLSRREDVTLFMLLLAAFQAVLARYTGQTDIAVGTPIANRGRPEIEPLIGFFINMLVLRSDLSGDPSFHTLLRRVREVTLGAYANQDVPFERLVEELAHERDLSRSPLFQVMLTLQNAPSAAPELPGLVVETADVDVRSAKYDLTVALAEAGAGLDGLIEYNTDLFDAATIGRLAVHLQTLLAGVVKDPDCPISALPLLPADEWRQLVHDWNATSLPYPADARAHHLFEAQVARTPEAPALLFAGQQISYHELDGRANRLAHHLRAQGVRPGGLVGICMERSTELVVAILGVLKAGGAYVPLDPTYPAERLQYMLEDAQVSVLLTATADHRPLTADYATRNTQHATDGADNGQLTVVDLDADWPTIARQPATSLDSGVTPDNLAYVIYTSGSTGRPKGVMVGHRNVVNFFAGMDRAIGGDQPGTWLAVTSVSFDISVLELLWTLARGFKVVLQPDRGQVYGATQAHGTSARPIDFSLFYFASGEQEGEDRYRLLLEGAKFADQHGFTAVWTPERHFHDFGALYPNPAVVGAALAVATERIQIRAGSVVLPLQNPIRVAEEWALVDNLSRGRAAISFASGWHADDFVLAPGNYADRKQIMLRDIEVVRRLWRGEAVEMTGGAGNPVRVRTQPRPIQPELPVWLTAGGSPETFRAAGAIGANLLTHLLGQSVEDLAEKIALYRRAWREHGHAGQGHVTLMLHTFVGNDMAEVRRVVRRPFGQYLKSSLDLWKNLARSLGRDVDSEQYTEEEEDALLSHAFDRYAQTSGLIGTPEGCLRMIDRLKAIDVDEIGCLIDFGVATDAVLDSLRLLDQVREQSNRAPAAALDPEEYTLPAQIMRHGVTHLQCTPSMAHMLLSEPAAALALGGLRQLMVGGEALPGALAEELRALMPGRLFNMYGPTETTIWSAVHPVETPASSIPIGRPVANTQIYILDRHMRPVPIGVPGELYIGGDGVVHGYLGRPELTAERFVPNPFLKMEDRGLKIEDSSLAAHHKLSSILYPLSSTRLYRTGDLARYRPDGAIEFLGRVDYQVKLGGHRIELGEIEAALRQHPQVREAVVAVRNPDPPIPFAPTAPELVEGQDGRQDAVGRGAEQPGSPYLAAYVVPVRQAALRPRLSAVEQAALLSGRKHYTLPNGMVIAHLSDLQANAGYREVIEEAVYLRHGVTLSDGDCVFDVGANIGFFTLFANQARRNVKVYAFEPIPTTFEVLRTNVELYGLDATLFPCGLSDSAGTADFTFYPEMAGLSGRYSETEQDRRATRALIMQSLRDRALNPDGVSVSEEDLDAILERQFHSERHVCQLRALSDVIAEQAIERIDLLKIDVEKSEYDVLRGIRAEDWPKIRQITMEVDTIENLERIRALLELQGFRVAVEDLVIVEASAAEGGMYVYMLYATRPAPAGARADGAAPQAEATGVPTPALLRDYLRARLPGYMIPSAVVLLDALPLTPNGKIDRRALPAPAATRSQAEAAYVAPSSELEQTIAEVWRAILRVEQVGIHDNFFELGGSSLLIVQARTRLREALGYDVSLVDLFRYPTVSGLAGYLGAAGQPARPSAAAGARARAERQVARRRQRMGRGGTQDE